MRIVVTGASGFVGTALVRELQRRGIETIATVRHPPDPLPVGTTVVQSYDDAPLGDVLVHLAEGRRMNAIDDASVQQLIRRCGRLLGKGYARPVYASSALHLHDEDALESYIAAARLPELRKIVLANRSNYAINRAAQSYKRVFAEMMSV